MIGSRALAPALVLVLLAACRIEDRTPSGTRHDQTAIQALIAEYARTVSAGRWAEARSLFWPEAVYAGALAGPVSLDQRVVPVDSALQLLSDQLNGAGPDEYDVRILRVDLRQEGDLAAAWVTMRRPAPAGTGAAERDWMDHFAFKRIDGEWRILSVALAATPRRRPGRGSDTDPVGLAAR